MRLIVLLTLFVSARAVTVTVPGLGTVLGTEAESAWTNRTIHAFYGIRFAQSPSGNRRFMPPEPAEPWSQLYDATSPGRDCPQFLSSPPPSDPEEDLEDCLLLNVFTPFVPDTYNNDSLLPVMVYIHGGGFYEGTARYFPPNYLLESDVVLVILQYRLGPLGFMSLHTNAIAGNVGFMDQVMGLKWVHQNIESFGGDKNKVTVFGQSAGAASISLLLLSPMVDDGLFQQAIFQSGSAFADWVIDSNPIIFSKALFRELTEEMQEVDDFMIEQRFKNATVLELYSAVNSLIAKDPSKASNLGQAVIQKAGSVKFLEGYPSDLAKLGKIKTLPIMAGITRHEGSYLVITVYDRLETYKLVNDSEYLKNNFSRDTLQMLGIEDDSGAFIDLLENKFYKNILDREDDLTFVDVSPGIMNIAGVLFFKSPTLRQAKINSLYNQPTFLYTFDYRGEHTRFGYGKDTSKYPFDGGVHHSNDLLYLFPYHYTEPLNEEDTVVSKIMVDLWTNFAINGIPSSEGSDSWEPIRRGRNGPYYHINSTCYMEEDFIENEYITATLD